MRNFRELRSLSQRTFMQGIYFTLLILTTTVSDNVISGINESETKVK